MSTKSLPRQSRHIVQPNHVCEGQFPDDFGFASTRLKFLMRRHSPWGMSRAKSQLLFDFRLRPLSFAPSSHHAVANCARSSCISVKHDLVPLLPGCCLVESWFGLAKGPYGTGDNSILQILSKPHRLLRIQNQGTSHAVESELNLLCGTFSNQHGQDPV
jgi:hypothetical protein